MRTRRFTQLTSARIVCLIRMVLEMSLYWTSSRDYRWVEVATASISTSACSLGVCVLDSLIGERDAGVDSLNQCHSLAYRAVKSESSVHLSTVKGGLQYSFVIPVDGFVDRSY